MEDIAITPAETIRTAAEQMRRLRGPAGPLKSGHAFWPALADLLDGEAHMVDLRGNSPDGTTFNALNVARAYLEQAG